MEIDPRISHFPPKEDNKPDEGGAFLGGCVVTAVIGATAWILREITRKGPGKGPNIK